MCVAFLTTVMRNSGLFHMNRRLIRALRLVPHSVHHIKSLVVFALEVFLCAFLLNLRLAHDEEKMFTLILNLNIKKTCHSKNFSWGFGVLGMQNAAGF